MSEGLLQRLPYDLQLLLRACRDGADSTGPALAPLVPLAREHRVLGLIYAGLLRHKHERWAAAPIAEAEAAQRDNAIRALELVRTTVHATQVLKAAGVACIALKGPLLSRRYYGDFGTRHAGDVDLLVDVAAAPAADAALQRAGYVRCTPARGLSARRLRLYLDTQHEFAYEATRGGPRLELHWRYADAPRLAPYPFAELHARSRAEDVAGLAIRTLSDRDTFVQLAVHGALDGWSRLKWIADLPRVLARLSALDLRAIDAEARAMGHQRVVTLALAMADAAEPPAWIDELLPRILRRLRDAGQSRTLSVALQDRRYLRALADDPAMREAIAYSALIMPDDFDALRMPDRLTPMLPYAAQARRTWRKLAR